jgi:hypothetical protein
MSESGFSVEHMFSLSLDIGQRGWETLLTCIIETDFTGLPLSSSEVIYSLPPFTEIEILYLGRKSIGF